MTMGYFEPTFVYVGGIVACHFQLLGCMKKSCKSLSTGFAGIGVGGPPMTSGEFQGFWSFGLWGAHSRAFGVPGFGWFQALGGELEGFSEFQMVGGSAFGGFGCGVLRVLGIG